MHPCMHSHVCPAKKWTVACNLLVSTRVILRQACTALLQLQVTSSLSSQRNNVSTITPRMSYWHNGTRDFDEQLQSRDSFQPHVQHPGGCCKYWPSRSQQHGVHIFWHNCSLHLRGQPIE